MMELADLKKYLLISIIAAKNAGAEIVKIYNSDFDVELKDDKSPLTLADKQANKKIEEFLFKTGIPILSEEGKKVSYEKRKNWEILWVVDPLDGTKEFVRRNGEFTVNIALVQNNRPILGVIYVPIKEELYFAAQGIGAYKIDSKLEGSEISGIDNLIEQATKLPSVTEKENFVVVGSRSHMSIETQDFINDLYRTHDKVEVVSVGSAIKLCLVAEGVADVYPRFAPTMEWDTAAGHAIANESGKRVIAHPSGNELEYNRENLVNPWFIVQE